MLPVRTDALFYEPTLTVAAQRRLIVGQDEEPALDVIDFPAEEGGDVERELAVPLLRGMDGIRVEDARLRVRAQPQNREISGFSVAKAAGDDAGLVLSLTRPGRFAKVTLAYPTFPSSVRHR